jgi:ribonuclease HII
MKYDSESLFPGNSDPLERIYAQAGVTPLCGVDEAGRGPLAGPVVAAAVVYRDCNLLWSCGDSKALSAMRREELFAGITSELDYAVGICTTEEIETINILQASLLAMEKAVLKLSVTPDLVLVDGSFPLRSSIRSRAIIHGDALVAVIGAASIVAKVTRDRIMTNYDLEYPHYGFAKHFGYPTAEHRRALKEFGPCPIHRKTYRGVREYYQAAD